MIVRLKQGPSRARRRHPEAWFVFVAACGAVIFSVNATAQTLQQKIAAAANAATTAPACVAISNGSPGSNGFYWEIDDANGIVTDPVSRQSAAGSVKVPGGSAPAVLRTTAMPVASASKWIYGGYVAELQASPDSGQWTMPAAAPPFLNFTSGYSNMQDGCSSAAIGKPDPTVTDCLNQPGRISSLTNGSRIPGLVGKFSYNGGHMEVLQGGADASIAGLMNGASDDDAALAAKVMNAFAAKGVSMKLSYFAPNLAGGVYTTPTDYAAFLQGLVRSTSALAMRYLLQPSTQDPYAVCTNPSDPACPTAASSPLDGQESFHYGIAHWIEDDPHNGDGAYSSAGAYGFYPWVDASKQFYGLVARADTSHSSTDFGPGYKSQQCGLAIRKAFFGVAASPSTTALASSVNPSTSNQATVLTATVSGNAPTGTVTFSDDNSPLCTQVPLRPMGMTMQAACMVALNSSRNITASYSGDGNNVPSISATMRQAVVAAAAFNPDQQGVSGSWGRANTPGTRQGFLFTVYPDNIAPGHGTIFVGWYTYDVAGGSGGQRWYALQGDVYSNSGSASLGIYTATDGNLDFGPSPASVQVGAATLSFSDCSTGALTYLFNDGRSGTIPLSRVTQSSICGSSGNNGNNPANSLLAGTWIVPNVAGMGFVIDISPVNQVLLGSWYTYFAANYLAPSPRQQWFVFQDSNFVPTASASINLDLIESGGGTFDATIGGGVTTDTVGQVSLRFQSCTTATFTYTIWPNSLNSQSVAQTTVNLVRLGPPPTGCTL